MTFKELRAGQEAVLKRRVEDWTSDDLPALQFIKLLIPLRDARAGSNPDVIYTAVTRKGNPLSIREDDEVVLLR